MIFNANIGLGSLHMYIGLTFIERTLIVRSDVIQHILLLEWISRAFSFKMPILIHCFQTSAAIKFNFLTQFYIVLTEQRKTILAISLVSSAQCASVQKGWVSPVRSNSGEYSKLENLCQTAFFTHDTSPKYHLLVVLINRFTLPALSNSIQNGK